MYRTKLSICLALAGILGVGCVRVGQPSPDDQAQLAKWSQLVSPKDRAEVERTAASRTDWMEKKKVQWMTTQYRTRYNRQQAKKATTQAAGATKPTSKPTTDPTIH